MLALLKFGEEANPARDPALFKWRKHKLGNISNVLLESIKI